MLLRVFILTFLLLIPSAGLAHNGPHNAWGSAAFSILPGGGQAYQGKTSKAAAYFATIVGLFFFKFPLSERLQLTLYQYQFYDAYQGGKSSSSMVGNENLFENYIASFNPLNAISLYNLPLGAFFSSVTYAASHYLSEKVEALNPVPMALRTLVGYLWAMQTTDEKHDLRKSIFSHTWFSLSTSGDQTKVNLSFEISLP